MLSFRKVYDNQLTHSGSIDKLTILAKATFAEEMLQ